jgi:hypothetical protein
MNLVGFPRNTLRPGALLGSLALVLTLQGCTLVGSGGGPASTGPTSDVEGPIPQGAFRGFMEIEGGRIDGVLTLTPSGGGNLEGFFEAPPDLVAIGRGAYEEGDLRLELSYEGGCPGKMSLNGRWQEGPGTLTGTVRADDCTGRAEGTFLFSPDLNSFFPVGNGGPSREDGKGAHSSAG